MRTTPGTCAGSTRRRRSWPPTAATPSCGATVAGPPCWSATSTRSTRPAGRGRAAGITVLEHPVRKDETDAELAVAAGRDPLRRRARAARRPRRRARPPARPRLHVARPGRARPGRAHRRAGPGRDRRAGPARLRLGAAAGARVSVLALSAGVVLTLRGLEYELTDEPLPATVCRGLRNRVAEPDARLELTAGVALVMVFDGAADLARLPRRRGRAGRAPPTAREPAVGLAPARATGAGRGGCVWTTTKEAVPWSG